MTKSPFGSDGLIGASVFQPSVADDTSGGVDSAAIALVRASASSATEVTVAAPLPVFSNDQIASYIQSGYFGTDYRWNLGNSGTAPQFGVLTYNTNGLTAGRAALAQEAFGLYEAVLGIDFVQVGGAADFTFDDNQAGAFASFSASGGIITSAFVNVDVNWFGGSNVVGDYTFQTFLHEIGHALGLGHAGNYNGTGNYVTDTTSPNFGNNSNHYLNDSWQATMMSYFSQTTNTYVDASYAFLLTPMISDWIALGNKYGLFGTAFSGNTTWGFNTNIGATVFANLAAFGDQTAFTIIDGSGIDTLDFSGYFANQRIDLRPESISDVGGLVGNMSIARGTVIEHAVGGWGSDFINGNDAANALTGNAGNDTLLGNSGIDTLQGGTGDDRLDGGLFADFSFGGDGNDTFVIKGADIADHVDGGAGTDTLDLSGYTNTALGFSVNLQSGLYDFTPNTFGPFSVVSVENVLGSARADTILGSAVANSLSGNDGNDLLSGNGGDDTLLGGNGNDTLEGGEGNDVIEGQGGTDTERGGNGNDRFVYNVGFGYPNSVDGGAGTDTFDFRAIGGSFSGTNLSINLVSGYSDIGGTMSLVGIENVWGSDSTERIGGSVVNNQLLGYGGNDTIGGNSGNDTVDGGVGNDSMGGGAGNDRVLGGDGTDTGFGDAGNDTMLGGLGNDSLGGGAGNDSLNGEAGNDRITGAAGRDILIGGAGADWFIYNDVTDSPNNAATCDVLMAGGGGSAFDLAGAGNGDRINLDALGVVWADITMINSGTNTVCLIDAIGTSADDMRIQINDGGVLASAYTAADFIF
jgi:serralysin